MTMNGKLAGGVMVLLIAQNIAVLPIASANPNNSPRLAQITPNTVTGQLDENSPVWSDGSYYDVHFFEGVAGQTVTVEMASDELDAFIMLMDPSSEIIAQANDSPDSTDASLTTVLPETGIYMVIANSYSAGETGQYVLTWKLTTSTAQSVGTSQSAGVAAGAVDSVNEQPEGNSPGFEGSTPLTGSEFSLEEGGMAAFQSVLTTEIIPELEAELDVLRARLGSEHPVVANKLSELATMYSIQGRYVEAESLLLEALEIYRALPDAYPEEEASILELLASTAYQSGQQTDGDSLLDEAEAVRENVGISPDAADAYDESSLTQSIEASRRNAKPYELAPQVRFLATIYHRQGRYEEAKELYQEAISIYRELPYIDPGLYISLNYLALLYQGQGLYKEAKSLYQEALENSESQLTSISNYQATTSFEAAGSNWQAYETSLQIYSTVPILYNLSSLYQVTGDISQAIGTFQRGLEIEERDFDFNLANLGEDDRVTYVANIASLNNTLNRVLSLSLNETSNAEAKQFALTILLRRKGRLLEASVISQEAIRQSATPDELNLINQLEQIRQEISSLTVQPPTNLSANEYQTRLTRLRSEARRLEGLLSRRSASSALASRTIEWQAV